MFCKVQLNEKNNKISKYFKVWKLNSNSIHNTLTLCSKNKSNNLRLKVIYVYFCGAFNGLFALIYFESTGALKYNR